MCSPVTSRGPGTWPRATRARRARSASPSPPPGPGATNLVTPIADAWMDSTPLVCITGQVRTHLIGTDAFQECDITGVTMPIVKHSWLVQDAREIPEVMKAAFHVARTGRCGPVLVDVPRDVQENELDFAYPESVDLPGWKPPTKVHPLQIREAAKDDRPRGQACPVRRRRHAQRRRLRRAAGAGRSRPAARDHHVDGQERLPGVARAAFRLARHARPEVVEHRHEQLRRARGRGRPLRRPRHRQARRVRPGCDRSSISTSTQPRSRSCARRTSPSSAR